MPLAQFLMHLESGRFHYLVRSQVNPLGPFNHSAVAYNDEYLKTPSVTLRKLSTQGH